MRRRITTWVVIVSLLSSAAFAAITEADLAENTSTTDATSFTTASQTPSANQLVLGCVASCTADSTEPNAPTITANGLTWVNVNVSLYWKTSGGTQRCKSTVFRAMGASPSAGTAVIDFAGQTQAVIGWSFAQFDGVNTGGTNGSSAVLQPTTNTATATSLTVTLAAFGSANNGAHGCFAKIDTTELFTVGSGFSLIFTGSKSSPSLVLGSEWIATNDTTVDMTWTTSSLAGGIALEIVAAGGATVVRHGVRIQ